MKKLILFSLVGLVALILFSAVFWFGEVRFMGTKASVTQASFSVDNSYLFVSPLKAKANSQEKIRVTVFILNSQGLGVLGKQVSLGSDPSLVFDNIQGLTDQFGKAVFDVSATKGGEYYLQVIVDSSTLKQQAHLSFY